LDYLLSIIGITTSFGSGIHFEQSLINTLTNIGALEYIRKPSNVEVLQEIIHKAFIRLIELESPNGEKETLWPE